jgi:large subunit ribosomal protein L35
MTAVYITTKEMKMPKMKTKSGAKKRFRVSPTGKVKAKSAKMRHMQMNKSKQMKRKARGQSFLCEANERSVVQNWMPYARVKRPKTTDTPPKNTAEKGGA